MLECFLWTRVTKYARDIAVLETSFENKTTVLGLLWPEQTVQGVVITYLQTCKVQLGLFGGKLACRLAFSSVILYTMYKHI